MAARIADVRANMEDGGVELHALLLSQAARWRDQLPRGVQFRRRLDGRGHYIRASAADSEAFCEALLAATVGLTELRDSLELSLIPVTIPRAPSLATRIPSGNWLRISLRWTRADSKQAVGFALPGSCLGQTIEPAMERIGAFADHCILPRHWTQAIHIPVQWIDPERAITTPRGGFGRILYVDDEPMVLEVHRQSIESLGYEVVPMQSALEALALFRTAPHAFELVISDQSMPQMDGDALARAIREINPDIPILLSTGLAAPDPRSAAERSHVTAILEKPFTLDELAQALRAALGLDAGQRAHG